MANAARARRYEALANFNSYFGEFPAEMGTGFDNSPNVYRPRDCRVLAFLTIPLAVNRRQASGADQ